MTSRRAPLALGGLVLASLLLRSQQLGISFWIDEALSVGIADRPLGDVPSILRLDGSPPLYYGVLHVWMRVLGSDSEAATRWLSLILALATIPVAWALTRALVGERAAWCAAVLAAVNPFLTQYAQETRMYSLVVLLGVIACAGFAGTFVLGRGRRWGIAFVVALVALLYTHNWALFLGLALGIAWLVLLARDRALLKPGLLTFGAVAVAYLPWLPSLAFQAAHTGAPWARRPTFEQLQEVPEVLVGQVESALLVLAGAVAFAGGLRHHRDGRAAVAWIGLAAGTVLIAFLASQASPAWATRYLAVALGPLLLGAAVLLSHAGRAGIAALALVVLGSVAFEGRSSKSNVESVAGLLAPALHPGDLVISTQPEQLPNVAYYLGDEEGLRYATLWGTVTDLGVTDWRDGVERMEKLTPERDLAPLLDDLPAGARVALVEPEIFAIERWSAPWTAMVRVRSAQWRAWMQGDGRFRVIAVRPEEFSPPAPNPVRATVFLKVGT